MKLTTSYYQQICLKTAVNAFCFRPDEVSNYIKQLAKAKIFRLDSLLMLCNYAK